MEPNNDGWLIAHREAEELRAEIKRLRAKLGNARPIALACLKRMRESGESHEMCARWISEELSK